MIKKVKDQTGKELTNTDVDRILLAETFRKNFGKWAIGPMEHAHNLEEFDFFSDVEAFITNALNQQRLQTIRDIRKWTKGKVVTKDKLREFLTKLEK